MVVRTRKPKIIAQFNEQNFTKCCGQEPTHYIWTSSQNNRITGADIVSVNGQMVGSVDATTARHAYTSAKHQRIGAMIPVSLKA